MGEQKEMITRLRLKGFQKHENLNLKLDRVTTIIGRTDNGKSAVLRAIRYLCLNKPGGDAFINHNTESCTVKMQVNGRTVTRRKGKANEYKLGSKMFHAFGTTVPEEIASLLNVGPENFQLQHEGPFWLTLTPGNVTKELNRIVDLGSIDESTASIASQLRDVRGRKGQAHNALTGAQAAIATLKPLRTIRQRLNRLQRLQGQLVRQRHKAAVLGDLIERALVVGKQWSDASQCHSGALTLHSKGVAVRKIIRTSNNVKTLINQIDSLTAFIARPTPDLIKVKEVKAMKLEVMQLKGYLSDAMDTVTQIDDNQTTIEGIEKKIAATLKGKNQCPLCKQPIR